MLIAWKVVEGKVKVRKGVKAPWLELEVENKDGKRVKLVAKVVESFFSDTWEGKDDPLETSGGKA